MKIVIKNLKIKIYGILRFCQSNQIFYRSTHIKLFICPVNQNYFTTHRSIYFYSIDLNPLTTKHVAKFHNAVSAHKTRSITNINSWDNHHVFSSLIFHGRPSFSEGKFQKHFQLKHQTLKTNNNVYSVAPQNKLQI